MFLMLRPDIDSGRHDPPALRRRGISAMFGDRDDGGRACSPAGRDALSRPPDEAKVTVSLRD